MARTLKRQHTEAGLTIATQLEGKTGSRREFGRLIDQMNARARKPRRKRKS